MPIGSVSLQQICRCPRGGKIGRGDKTLTTFHLSEKKGLAKRNPMVAGTKARESMQFFERSSELIHVFFSKVKTKIRSMKNKGGGKTFLAFSFLLVLPDFFFLFLSII